MACPNWHLLKEINCNVKKSQWVDNNPWPIFTRVVQNSPDLYSRLWLLLKTRSKTGAGQRKGKGSDLSSPNCR